ncbi:MAG: family 16 glycosylhydrolase [Treponema sp.]|nr:family 16 glycosylhydrolase [Treponema sp.]
MKEICYKRDRVKLFSYKRDRVKLFFTEILLSAMFLTLSGCASTPKNPDGWSLVWSDEFNGKSLDRTKWDFQLGTGSQYGLNGWGNDEIQYYTEDNISLKKGNLIIEARKENKNGLAYTSSRIRTYKDDGTILYAPLYGRIEARMLLPSGSGIWPAFWLLPATDKYGVWASSGEIDILEAKGRLTNRTYGNVHFGQPWPGNKYTGGMHKFQDEGFDEDYHVYALEWEPGSLKWFVDDDCFYETSSWWAMGLDDEEPYAYPAPFDVPFYIVLNLAVGGTFDDYRVPDAADIPAQMYVDYVRVYEKIGGYNYDVKRPVPPQDTEKFLSYDRGLGNDFIADKEFETAELTGALSNTMDKNSSNWYFLTLSDFGGSATAEREEGAFHIKIKNCGGELHSVQLIQHLGIAKGYTYQIVFDAKAASERTISVKLGGDDDNKWAVYSSQYSPKLTTEYQTFKYRFTMEDDSDPQSRLEFNIGTNPADVWIKNVKVLKVDD